MADSNNYLFYESDVQCAVMPLKSGSSLGSIQLTYTAATDTAGTGTKLVNDLILITGVQYDQQTNHQLVKSLGNYNYLYSFGDMPSQVSVSGVILPALASGTDIKVTVHGNWLRQFPRTVYRRFADLSNA